MIDTISLEIYDINPPRLEPRGFTEVEVGGTNYPLYLALTEWQSRKTYDISDHRGAISRDLIIGSMDNDDFKEKFRIANRQSSSNYKITILVSLPNDKLSVEFSLPKYFFGQNLNQIVKSPFETQFNWIEGITNTLPYQAENLYNLFVDHLKMFFKIEFPEVKLNYEQVMLKRIDLCYNQIFRDKAEAMKYLDMQKQLSKKYQKVSKNPDYKDSVFHSTNEYSFKIYHKGNEYRKHDANEISKRKGQNQVTEIEQERLKKFADRILRYEITFRRSMITYLYIQKLYRKQSQDYQFKLREIFNKMKYYDQEGWVTPDSFKMKELVDNTYSLVLPSRGVQFGEYLRKKYDPKEKVKEVSAAHLIKWYMKFFTDFSTQRTAERKFWLKTNHVAEMEAKEDNQRDYFDLEYKVDQPFNKAVLKTLTDYFIKTIKQFQPVKYDGYSEMCKRLNAYNDQAELSKQLNKGLVLNRKGVDFALNPNYFKTIFLVLKTCTFRKYRELVQMPERTYYRQKAQLEKIGITEDMVVSDINIEAPLNYDNYYTFINENMKVLSKLLLKGYIMR